MTPSERIKTICKDKGIPVSRMERDLGFANGYIGQLKKTDIPYERMIKISEYLGVTPQYILTGEEVDAPYISDDVLGIAQFLMENPDYRLLFETSRKVSPADLKLVIELVDRMKK